MKDHKAVKVDHVFWCDLCTREGLQVVAQYDGATRMGPWAYMCKTCFESYGVGLGLGLGQELIYG